MIVGHHKKDKVQGKSIISLGSLCLCMFMYFRGGVSSESDYAFKITLLLVT